MIAEKKKSYQKPDLFFESIAHSQNIASGCEGIALFGENACAVKIDLLADMSVMIFQNPSICEFTPPSTDDFICYHAPSEMNNVFSS